MRNRYLDEVSKLDYWERFKILFDRLKRPIDELSDGIGRGTFPWLVVLLICIVIELALFFRLDLWIFSRFHFVWLYPKNLYLYYFYYFACLSSPLWFWAWKEVFKKEKIGALLKEIFQSVGLKNNLGRFPTIVFDKPIDSVTIKLRLSRASMPLSEFEKAKPGLESGLRVFID